MKTVTAQNDTSNDDNDLTIELAMRKRARKIIERVFPNVVPDFRLIETINKIVVVTDEDGAIVEDDFEDENGETMNGTKTNTENLLSSRAFAKEAYADDSPSATVAAYEALYVRPSDEELHDKLDEMLELLAKRKK